MGLVEETFGGLGNWVNSMMPEGDLRSLIVDGVIAGLGGTVIFLPQIMILFFFIGLMETTGYMSRAAYLMDGVMTKVGLSGRAFLPPGCLSCSGRPGLRGSGRCGLPYRIMRFAAPPDVDAASPAASK